MGKTKTHQGTAKRIKVTGRGKLLRGHQMSGHFKVVKSPRRQRALAQEVPVHAHFLRKIERLLPYR
ncbi:MAG TPA: 50S ribosomal protein L35 [bacterium]|jgi:large subunit ribosomal protein L35|nr:50S ribosomal protein L35 [bacterium]